MTILTRALFHFGEVAWGLAEIFLVWCKLARKGKNKNKRATFRAQYMLMLVGERNATVPIDCYLHIVTTAQ